MVLILKNVQEASTLLSENREKLVVVDFFATWCGPCKTISPLYEKLTETYPNVIFRKVDVDEAEDLAAKYSVTAMPTFVLLKGEKAVETVVGASIEKLEAAIKKHATN